MNSRFLAVAQDPALITAVHHTIATNGVTAPCDEADNLAFFGCAAGPQDEGAT